MNLMNHKGDTARIEYCHEDDCFVDHIAGIKDVVGFHGDSVVEWHVAFAEAVDDYLEACDRLERSPQKPYSGKVMLRIDAQLHAQAATIAEAKGKSLNAWAQEVFLQAIATV